MRQRYRTECNGRFEIVDQEGLWKIDHETENMNFHGKKRRNNDVKWVLVKWK